MNQFVYLSLLDRDFNAALRVYHFFLGDVILFHIMDFATQLSALTVLVDTNMTNAIYSLECIWFG